MTEFIGRLHPLVIHLPIGFLVLLTALELLALNPRFRHLAPVGPVILALTIPAAAVGVFCGWLLSLSGGYDELILVWHKWLGVVVGVAVAALFVVRRQGAGRTYWTCLVVTLLLLAGTGHYGASLTHGSDYLAEPLRKIFRLENENSVGQKTSTLNIKSQSFYSVVIQPIFKDNCITCHGPKKSKAKLRLDTPEYIEHGGKSGAVIVPNSAALSLMIKRLELPLDHEDHMPPEGKPQPTAEDIQLLRWWIDSGADTTKTFSALNPPAAIMALLKLRVSQTN